MAGKATAVDIGSHSVRAIEVKDGKHGLQITGFASAPAADGVRAIAGAVPLKNTTVGLAGRAMTLRYTQVPPGPDWQLRVQAQFLFPTPGS